jgi:predicted nucleic acid-binding protein
MITSIDTNILLDVFLPDPEYSNSSAALLKDSFNKGKLLICEIVYAELVPQFHNKKLLDETLAKINISLSSLNSDIAYLAGERWKRYRQSGGKRTRIITDFLIGAHALKKTDLFLTRDRGFYSTYFPELFISH